MELYKRVSPVRPEEVPSFSSNLILSPAEEISAQKMVEVMPLMRLMVDSVKVSVYRTSQSKNKDCGATEPILNGLSAHGN